MNSQHVDVILVHGTWGADPAGWYQRDSEFCQKLLERLAAQLPTGEVHVWPFEWCGRNNHRCRVGASKQLCARILELRALNPSTRIHVVAHSHGGNVAIHALELFDMTLQDRAALFAKALAEDGATLDGDAIHEFADGSGISRAAVSVLRRKSQALPHRTYLAVGPGMEARLANPGFTAAVEEHIVTHPDSTRLGTVVCIGTPFFRKRWRRWSREVLGARAVHLLSTLPLAVAVGGFAGMVALTVTFFGPVLLFPALEAFYPTWLLWLTFTAPAVALASLHLAHSWSEGEPMDVNIYCEGLRRRRKPVPMLVVSAGDLDEALLGLTARTVIAPLLAPRIDDVLSPRIAWDAPRAPVRGQRANWLSRLLRLAISPISMLLALVRSTCLAIVRPLAAPLIKYVVERAVLGLATGLPARESVGAHVDVSSSPGEIAGFSMCQWDATHEAAGQALLREPGPHVADRYAFLWDDAALAKRLDRSGVGPLLSRLKTERLEVAAPLKGSTEERLPRLLLALEEKAAEVVGRLQLSHSGYYSSPAVVRLVADFLVNGEAPEPPVRDSTR